MANLTLSIDDALLRRARIRALEQGTSVNAVVRELLESYADDAGAYRARLEVVDIARAVAAGTPGSERRWRRADLYDERTGWPRS